MQLPAVAAAAAAVVTVTQLTSGLLQGLRQQPAAHGCSIKLCSTEQASAPNQLRLPSLDTNSEEVVMQVMYQVFDTW